MSTKLRMRWQKQNKLFEIFYCFVYKMMIFSWKKWGFGGNVDVLHSGIQKVCLRLNKENIACETGSV